MPVTIPNFERQQNLPTKYEGLTTGLTSGLKLGYGIGESMMKLPVELAEKKEDIKQKQLANQLKEKYGERATLADILSKETVSQLYSAQTQQILKTLPYLQEQTEADLESKKALAKYHTEQANALIRASQGQLTPSENAQIEEHQEHARLYKAQAEEKELLNKDFKNLLSDQPAKIAQAIASMSSKGMQQQPTTQTQQSQPSVGERNIGNYGVDIPHPTAQDFINKARKIDTYSAKLKAALEERKKQEDMFTGAVIDSNKAVQDASEFDNLLNQYNYNMDRVWFTGGASRLLPTMSEAGQNVDNIINKMSLGAIEQVRDKMNSARFAVADLNVALGMKPQNWWSPGTRKFYTDFSKAVKGRLDQQSQFYNLTGFMRMPKQYADALWTAYQNQYPISNPKGDAIIERKGDEWKQFATPEALNAIMTTGKFSPISQKDITEENVRDTMKATGKSRKEILTLLKAQGYDVSKLEKTK